MSSFIRFANIPTVNWHSFLADRCLESRDDLTVVKHLRVILFKLDYTRLIPIVTDNEMYRLISLFAGSVVGDRLFTGFSDALVKWSSCCDSWKQRRLPDQLSAGKCRHCCNILLFGKNNNLSHQMKVQWSKSFAKFSSKLWLQRFLLPC